MPHIDSIAWKRNNPEIWGDYCWSGGVHEAANKSSDEEFFMEACGPYKLWESFSDLVISDFNDPDKMHLWEWEIVVHTLSVFHLNFLKKFYILYVEDNNQLFLRFKDENEYQWVKAVFTRSVTTWITNNWVNISVESFSKNLGSPRDRMQVFHNIADDFWEDVIFERRGPVDNRHSFWCRNVEIAKDVEDAYELAKITQKLICD